MVLDDRNLLSTSCLESFSGSKAVTTTVQIATKRIGGHTYCVIFPPLMLREAYGCLAKWCIDPQLNFNERAFVEMAREMERNDQENR